jgi:hypothetical protein
MQLLRQRVTLFSFLLIAVLLSACAQLGLPTAETFNQKLAVGYGTVTQVRETATQLLVAKKIDVDDAKNVQTTADAARAGLDTARAMYNSGQIGPAEQRLNAARTALTALSAYLASREK